MPIYYDGGATLSKVYFHDGSSPSQIGKIYANDGEENHLIYTATQPETPIILNGEDQVSAITGGWTLQNNGGYEYEQGWSDGSSSSGRPAGWYMCYSGNNANGQGWMCTNNPFRVSGYSTLKLTAYYAKGYGGATPGDGYIYIALTTSKSYSGGVPGSSTMNGANIKKSKVHATSASNGTVTVTLDISSIDGGPYYVQVGRWNKTASCVYRTGFLSVEFA